MSRRRLLISLTFVAAVGVATIVLITMLRDAAPVAEAGFITEGSRSPEDPEDTSLTCERRLGAPVRAGLAPGAPIGRVRSSEVVNCPDLFDGGVVAFVGEVIGDVLHREGGAWLLVNDDAYALETGPLPAHRDYRGTNTGLAVWVPTDLAEAIEVVGGAGVRGDVFEFVGVIHRVDPQDGGGLTLRATGGALIERGGPVEIPTHRAQAAVAVVLALTTLLATLGERWRAHRR